MSTNTRTLNPVTKEGEAGQVLLPLWDYPLQPVINAASDYCGGLAVGALAGWPWTHIPARKMLPASLPDGVTVARK